MEPDNYNIKVMATTTTTTKTQQELADQLGVTLASPGDSPAHHGPGEEGGAGGPAPPIPDGKPCKW